MSSAIGGEGGGGGREGKKTWRFLRIQLGIVIDVLCMSRTTLHNPATPQCKIKTQRPHTLMMSTD